MSTQPDPRVEGSAVADSGTVPIRPSRPQITIPLGDPSDLDRLRVVAARTGQSAAAFMRMLINEGLIARGVDPIVVGKPGRQPIRGAAAGAVIDLTGGDTP